MSMDFYEKLENKLDLHRRSGTYKNLRYITSSISGKTSVENYGEVVLLCSNNYLGLANKPQLIEAGINALKKYGAGGASVRFICGTFDIHRILEEKIAAFLHTEAALTYTSCWNANTAVIPAILEPGDFIISDELNHASIIDGCRLAGKDVKKMIYRHADLISLEEKLRETRGSGTILIITDGVFSMEGDIAPLPGIIELAKKYGAIVMVDDSHSTGVLGETGRGTAEYYGMLGEVDIITGTFGKALGGAGGGFVAGKKQVIEMCLQRSRPHLFSNSLPPVLAAVALAAIEYLDSNPEIVKSLRDKVNYFRNNLKKEGIFPLEGDSAIIPLMFGDTVKAIKAAEEMLEKGVYAIGFGYPVVPEGEARIRIQVSDMLSYGDIDFAVRVIKEVCLKNGYIKNINGS
ncbi:MAG TPA: glycine C-acetyltransferase [Clostridiaceae bacterium]|nr:glycine C-acetyltransferase [Clostridiaceae bacterium]